MARGDRPVELSARTCILRAEGYESGFMSTESEKSGQARADESLEHHEILPWRESYPVFAAVVQNLIGTDRPSAIAAYLGPRINAQTVRDWRLRRAGVPAWAIETTRQHLAKLTAKLALVSPGPGRTGDIQRKRKAPPT